MAHTAGMVPPNNSLADDCLSGSSHESRAYQIEMFEQSMQGNTIVTMETGSGKTQIAKLRIEAELERTPEKRVWFCAPNVVLAQQQYLFFLSHLPAIQTRLITGHDNIESWSGQTVWDAVLHKIDLVVSTPQVLLDALSHGFVSLAQLSLLVFDEAHHCVANAPMALIMHRFYHPYRNDGPATPLPHILGLSASPITNKVSKLDELERNMHAVCKTPTLQVEDYKRHIFIPKLEEITFLQTKIEPPPTLKALEVIVTSLTLHEDPTVIWLRSKSSQSVLAEQKLNKILTSGRTPVMRQMESFLSHAKHISENVGPWAAEVYIVSCAAKIHDAAVLHQAVVPGLADREHQYIDSRLVSIRSSPRLVSGEPATGVVIAPKAKSVIEYLQNEYHPGITGVVFVQRRSVAYALTQLLQHCSEMQQYKVFSFVGSSNPVRRSLIDLADMQAQNEAFADFKAGERNICIATQVMEEGVDIQATNLVIRFDEPSNFRSFIQSRGRARRPDSKFIMVREAVEINVSQKIEKWHELEQIMKEQYSDLTRNISERLLAEDEDEDGDELYRVPSTGAQLSYDNARQHLEHFCSTLPPDEHGEPVRPIMIVSGSPFGHKTVKVVLPSSVPSFLQTTHSLRSWRTERMAKKDAAFQTYRKLHVAQLVNDNLLPHRQVKSVDEKMEGRDAIYKVRGAINPWSLLMENAPDSPSLYQHRVRITGNGAALPDAILLLPIQLDCDTAFTLYPMTKESMSVTISPESCVSTIPNQLAFEITSYLFRTVLGRRLKSVGPDNKLSYFVVPDVAPSDLPAWFAQIQQQTPLSEMKFDHFPGDATYLLKITNEEILYRWTPSIKTDITHGYSYSPDEFISAERLSKQLSFIEGAKPTRGIAGVAEPDVRTLAVHDCFVQGLPPAYGIFMLLMPTISYMLEISLRGQLALTTALSSVGFGNSQLIRPALTSSSALFEHNYESLEFVGDSILKYYASIQVYFDHPNLTEGGLTAKCHNIVNNARLQRCCKEAGLDAYITTSPFSGQKWTLAAAERNENQRQMSSKTLADVVEALIGAAYLDECNGPTQDELPLAALSHLFPEVQWKSPNKHITDFKLSSGLPTTHIARLEDVETMIGHEFQHKSLLVEALTRTSMRAGMQSFQRLEFMGDAILDRIVNVALYRDSIERDPEQLKYRRDALVSEWTLAFIALEAHHTVITNKVETTLSGQTSIVPTAKQNRLVDYMRTISDSAQIQQRAKAESSFQQARDEILTAFESGDQFPWIALHSINSSKSYSDIVESILGAVFIDSGGHLSACEKTLEALGLMKLLRRISTVPNIELKQPIVRLRLMIPEIVVQQKTKGKLKDGSKKWVCGIAIDGAEVAQCESVVSEKHAEACAAEMALKHLQSRDPRHSDAASIDDGMKSSS